VRPKYIRLGNPDFGLHTFFSLLRGESVFVPVMKECEVKKARQTSKKGKRFAANAPVTIFTLADNSSGAQTLSYVKQIYYL
jgi:pyruvate/2-oxoglutarate dehydrogenase complex dihydrolipoamide acyltransferase (E2) component